MKLKSEKITIDGIEYTASELPIKAVMPLIPKMSAENPEGQFELIGKAVSVNGTPIGADSENLGTGAFMKLIKIVLRLNGMGDEGNAS